MDQRNAVANRLRFLHDKKATLPLSNAESVPTARITSERLGIEPQKSTIKPVAATFGTDDFVAMPLLSSSTSSSSSFSASDRGTISMPSPLPSQKEHVDFGAVLSQRRRRSQWLCEMRKKSDKNSDYERFSLEYILRRRYDVAARARMPHMNESEYKDVLCAAHAEREILYNAMQAEADLGRVCYLLHLQGPWCEKTMTTVREPDLFGRAVTFLLSEVFYSRSMRVRWLAPPPLEGEGESEKVDCITLEISWDQAMFKGDRQDTTKGKEKDSKAGKEEEEKVKQKEADDLSWLTPLLPEPMSLPAQTPAIATLIVVDDEDNRDDSALLSAHQRGKKEEKREVEREKETREEEPVHASVVKMSSQQKLAQLRAQQQRMNKDNREHLRKPEHTMVEEKRDVLELLLPVEEPRMKSERRRQHGAYEYVAEDDE